MDALTAAEARVLGSLIEKQLATPAYYPLTLNALMAACNQTSSRDPVTNYGEEEVSGAVAGLRAKGLARTVLASGSRAPKYRHVLDEVWGLDDEHRAVLAVLLLRGPQTVGELRTRTERMAAFAGLDAVEEVLGLLARREEPLVRRLERQPGQKELRWAQLLSGPPEAVSGPPETVGDTGGPVELSGTAAPTEVSRPDLAARVAALEEEVDAMRAQIQALRAAIGERFA